MSRAAATLAARAGARARTDPCAASASSDRRFRAAAAAFVLLAGCGSEGVTAEPFAVSVVSFEPGEGAGFGQDRFPGVVLGPPRGGGERTGSTDVLSLGEQGSIVLELGADAIDGDGPDLAVFENAFLGPGNLPFAELAEVSVSQEGVTFVAFPCADDGTGCGGRAPVLANADANELDPLDPSVAGGDLFDLAALGVPRARYVRIIDRPGGPELGATDVGFDLDAIGVLHSE